MCRRTLKGQAVLIGPSTGVVARDARIADTRPFLRDDAFALIQSTAQMSDGRHPEYRKPERDPRFPATSRPRRCLMCGSRFDSAWSGERICRSCKTKSVWRTGVQPVAHPRTARHPFKVVAAIS
jgi:hypothetical protein